MKIVGAQVSRTRMLLVGGERFRAKGKRISAADSTVVRVDTDDNSSGWDETCPLGATCLPC